MSTVSLAPIERTALYCPLCDQYFFDEASCAAHIQHSSNHPQCEPCGIRFANGHCRRQHWCESPRHQYCVACELEFQTAAGLRVHFEFAAVHRGDDDDYDDDDDDTNTAYDDAPGWEDDLGRRMFPDDVEQPADDDFDIGEMAFAVPTLDDLREIETIDDNGDVDDLDPDEECEYDFGVPITESSELSASSAIVVTRAISTQAHAAATEAQDAEKNAVEKSVAEQEDDTIPRLRCHCPLCLEELVEPSATRCGHVFCTSCIRSAFDIKCSCPVCRTPAVPRQLRKLFLTV